MSISIVSDAASTQMEIRRLFDEKPPVLAEVRFPKMGTASDWYLCEDAAAVEAILGRLSSGAEIHLSSVWDLKLTSGAIVIRK